MSRGSRQSSDSYPCGVAANVFIPFLHNSDCREITWQRGQKRSPWCLKHLSQQGQTLTVSHRDVCCSQTPEHPHLGVRRRADVCERFTVCSVPGHSDSTTYPPNLFLSRLLLSNWKRTPEICCRRPFLGAVLPENAFLGEVKLLRVSFILAVAGGPAKALPALPCPLSRVC